MRGTPIQSMGKSIRDEGHLFGLQEPAQMHQYGEPQMIAMCGEKGLCLTTYAYR